MQILIPIFMGLLNSVASITSSNELSQSKRIAAPGLWNPAERRLQMNLDYASEQPVNWNDDDSRFENDGFATRGIFGNDNIDVDSIDDVDEAGRSIDELDNNDLAGLSVFLMKLLRQPVWKAPLVIIEEPTISQETDDPDSEMSDKPDNRPAMGKRSRYYRRYPWKRQNSRSRHGYDYDATHFCQPSREDVYQLLVALHNVRQGNKRRLVNFCKRHRSAGTVFTNIRFLGR